MWNRKKLFVILFVIQLSFAQQRAIDNFPNPRTNGYSKCGLKSRGYVCDPEKQLTEQERYRLNNDLLQLSRRTSGDRGVDFCTTKGVDATLFITKQGNEQLARQLNNIWAVDGQCKKSLVFVLSTNDHRLYYSVDKHTPISTQSFQAIIDKNQQLLNEDKFTMALTAIFTELGEAIQDNREEKIKPDYEHKIQNSVGTSQISVLTYFMIVPLIVLHLFAK